MHAAVLRLSFVTALAAGITAFAAGNAAADPGHHPAVRYAPSHGHASPAHGYHGDYAAPSPAYQPVYAARSYQPAYRSRRPIRSAFLPRRNQRVEARSAYAPRLDRDSRILQRRFDLDRDGHLDAGERADLAAELRRMKRDGDSRFTDTGRASALAYAGDRNRDGRLSIPELRAMLDDVSLVQVFAAFDRNADTMLSRRELELAPMLESLRRADLDRSAYLSWRELDSYLSRDHRRLSRR